MEASQVARVLKRDGLGRIELLETPGGAAIRRVACGGPVPGSALIARLLLRRERRALERLAGLSGVPQILGVERGGLLRTFLAGTPLHAADRLPEDFFDHLEVLVEEVHRRGVCHNDLHKEPNILVQPDGRPAMIDFQLASECSKTRIREDLRHVDKHRKRYLQRGRPHSLRRRSLGAALWMMTGKRIYNLVTHRLFKSLQDNEPRRPKGGPWPEWGPPLSEGRGSSAAECGPPH